MHPDCVICMQIIAIAYHMNTVSMRTTATFECDYFDYTLYCTCRCTSTLSTPRLKITFRNTERKNAESWKDDTATYHTVISYETKGSYWREYIYCTGIVGNREFGCAIYIEANISTLIPCDDPLLELSSGDPPFTLKRGHCTGSV